MGIVKMKRLKLFALVRDQAELLRRLRRLGCVELRAPQLPDGPPPFLTRPDARALDEAVTQAERLADALDILKREAPQKEGFLKARPQVPEGRLFDDLAYRQALSAAEDITGYLRDINSHESRRGKLESQRAALRPWLDLAVPLDVTAPRDAVILFGAIPLHTPREDFTAALDAATDLYEVSWAGEDRELRYLMLLCHRSAQEAVQAVLTEQSFTRVDLRGCHGTAAVCDVRLAGQLAETDAWLDSARENLRDRGAQRDALRLAYDRAQQEIALERARQELWNTQSAFCLEGWLPAERAGEVEAVLSAFPAAWELTDPAPEDYPDVPVQLKDNVVARSMNTITEMYSLPAYDGIDPNPWMAPFFIFFFGMMMADMGYGILMILGSALFLKKTRPKNPAFMEMIFWCGISTFIVGALTGGFFGDFIPKLLSIIDPGSTFTMPALLVPLDDIVVIMVGSLALGLLQIFTGMGISVAAKCRRGEFLDALFDEIAWWIVLLGLAAFVVGAMVPGVPAVLGSIGKVLLVAGALMLALGGTRKAKGFGKFTALVGIVYNGVTGFFSDTLSYIRLMALMVSGSVIASVFNTLGATFGNVILFVVISVVGNALNMALNLLGCYVHDLRLQCLEFFGRFYKEGGKPFRPLKVDTKYVEIIKEEQ